AYRLSRFVSLAKLITERAVQLDEIDAHTAYYREVQTSVEADAGPARPPRALSPEEARRRAALLEERALVQLKYDDLTMAGRDIHTVTRMRKHLGVGGTCAMVFGMAHKDSLAALLSDGGNIAVVVVAPYDAERMKRGEI